MGLLPPDIAQTIPPLYAQEGKGNEAIAYVKFFHLLSDWAWYGMEYDPVERLFFGWVWSDPDNSELGYFSLDELEEVEVLGVRIERDTHFEPMPLSAVKQL